MKYLAKFLPWLANRVGSVGAWLIQAANWIAPPEGFKAIDRRIDWSDCAKPHYPWADEEQTETMHTVTMPRGTYRVGVLRRRSDPPPRGQA